MIPSSLARSTVSISRRVSAGAGYVDTAVASGVKAHVEMKHKMLQTPAGTQGMVVTVLHLQPCDAQAGDRVTLTNGTVVEIRTISTVYGMNGTTVSHIKCEAW